ncbi:MAG: type II toxin-antitoxin system VapC family toxin, partial [Opitutales bacterium]
MVDTCFLIDYQRESKSKVRGAVASFLRAHADERLQISPIAWGEFLAGFEDEAHPFVGFVHDRLDFVPLEPEVGFVYREKFRLLKASGNSFGANDLWIGCHALSRKQALVTRNHSDFERIPGLKVVEY